MMEGPEGPSNVLELLQFFSDALEQRYANGNPILSAGEAVVMDSCGFPHARHVDLACMRYMNALYTEFK